MRARARELGVRVVVATRASAATTRETCARGPSARARARPGTLPPRTIPRSIASTRWRRRLRRIRVDSWRRFASVAWTVGAMGASASNATALAAAEIAVAADGAADAVSRGRGRRARRPGTRRPRARRRRQSRRLREGTKPRRVPRRDVRARPHVSLRRRRGRRRRRVRRVRRTTDAVSSARGGDGGVGGVDGRGGGGVRARRRRAVATTRTVAPSQCRRRRVRLRRRRRRHLPPLSERVSPRRPPARVRLVRVRDARGRDGGVASRDDRLVRADGDVDARRGTVVRTRARRVVWGRGVGRVRRRDAPRRPLAVQPIGKQRRNLIRDDVRRLERRRESLGVVRRLFFGEGRRESGGAQNVSARGMDPGAVGGTRGGRRAMARDAVPPRAETRRASRRRRTTRSPRTPEGEMAGKRAAGKRASETVASETVASGTVVS